MLSTSEPSSYSGITAKKDTVNIQKEKAVVMYVMFVIFLFIWFGRLFNSVESQPASLFFRQWRAPEEYLDHFLTEKVDVYSLGNNIYALLTGLMPYQERGIGWEDAYELGSRGEKVFIDPRYRDKSLAEAKLVEIIERCHELNPDHRPSIFEVVGFLRKALQEFTSIGVMDNGTGAR